VEVVQEQRELNTDENTVKCLTKQDWRIESELVFCEGKRRWRDCERDTQSHQTEHDERQKIEIKLDQSIKTLWHWMGIQETHIEQTWEEACV
jgi:hypothetical protein